MFGDIPTARFGHSTTFVGNSKGKFLPKIAPTHTPHILRLCSPSHPRRPDSPTPFKLAEELARPAATTASSRLASLVASHPPLFFVSTNNELTRNTKDCM